MEKLDESEHIKSYTCLKLFTLSCFPNQYHHTSIPFNVMFDICACLQPIQQICLCFIVQLLLQWFSMKRQHAVIVMADYLYYSKFRAYCQVELFSYIAVFKHLKQFCLISQRFCQPYLFLLYIILVIKLNKFIISFNEVIYAGLLIFSLQHITMWHSVT